MATRRSPRRVCFPSRVRNCASSLPIRSLRSSNGWPRTTPSTSPPPIGPPTLKARHWFLPPPAAKLLDRRISEDARAAGIPVNAVDRPELCDFFTPAIVNRAPLAVAIGTEGAGPVLAQMVRARIDRLLSPSLGSLALLANSFRGAAERLLPKGTARRSFWNEFFTGAPSRAMEAGDAASAHRAASRIAVALRRSAGPHRAGRRRSGRGGSFDVARAPAADGSRCHCL